MKGHSTEVRGIAFSSDGLWLASASHDQTLKVWNVASGQLVRTLEGHDSGVMSVAFSSDGKRLASASCDQTVKLWDFAGFQELLTLKGHAGQVVGVAFSSDGNRLASASYDQTVRVWEVAPESKPFGNVPAFQSVAQRTVPSDEMAVVQEVGRTSRLLTNGNFAAGLEGWQREGGANEFRTFAQGDEMALTTAGAKRDADTGRLYQCFRVPLDATELKFWLHGGADAQTTYVALWSSTILQRRVSGRNENTPLEVSWNVVSQRGRIVTLEIVDNSTFIWGFLGAHGFELVRQQPTEPAVTQPAVTDDDPLTLKGHSQAVFSVAISADGKRVVSGSRDQTVKVWDAVSGELSQTIKVSSYCVALSPDGKWLATGGHDKTVTLQDAVGIQEAKVFKGLGSAVTSVAFRPDGKQIAAGDVAGTLKVWDIQSGQETLTVRTPAWRLAWSADGQRLATAQGNNPIVKLWDASNGQELRSWKLHAPVHNFALSADGQKIAFASSLGTRVSDIATSRELLTLNSISSCVAFDPQGQRIAAASYDTPHAVALWDAATGRPLRTLKGHTQSVECVAFSGDGKRLVTGGEDLTVRVWELAPRAPGDATPPRKKTPPIPVLTDGQQLLTLKGHTGDVSGVAFSSDSKQLVTSSHDKTVKLWSTTTGQETLTLQGHTGAVRCVAISPDGTRVASAGQDQFIKIWNSESGRELVSVKGDAHYLTCVTFSPDGKRLASAGVSTAKVWDAATGQELFPLKGHQANVHGIAFSPDGKRIASGSMDQTVKLWDSTNGKELLSLKGHASDVSSVAFSPDGKWLASSSHDQTVKLWDSMTGQEKQTLIGHTSYVSGVSISPDGKRIASVSWDSTVRLWDSATGQETLTIKGYSHRVNAIAFSPDSKRLATSSDDRTVKLWDLTLSPNDKKSAANPPMPQKEADRPVTLTAETARVTQATQDDPLTVSLKGHAEAVAAVAISPDGKWLASGSSDGVVVWDVADRKPRFTLRAHGPYAISSVVISPDGKRLAAGVEQFVKVWDAATGAELLSLAGKTDRVNGVAFSSDGKRIAAATQGQTVIVWDSTSGKVLDSLTEKLQSFGAVAFSPDGQWLAAGTLTGDTTARLWNTANKAESFLLHGHQLYIKSLSFSSDGQRLATASDDGTVKVWDPQTSEDLLTMHDHRMADSKYGPRPNEMKSAALSLDGKQLVSAGSNGIVTVWDAATGQKRHSMEGHAGAVLGVAFSPDGKWVASAGADATVKLWTLAGRPAATGDGTIIKALVDTKQAETDLKALAGTWQVTDYEPSTDQPRPPEFAATIKQQRWVFQGDVLTVLTHGTTEGVVITIDPTQPLKAIDLKSFDQRGLSAQTLGIYSLAGDTLKVSLSPIESGRPKEMKPSGQGLGVLTLTRSKAPDVKLEDAFNFHVWRQASQKLQRLRVRTRLWRREYDPNDNLDRGFGLPKTLSIWAVIELPASEDGIPAAIWSEIAATSHVAVVAPSVNDALLKQLAQHRGLIALHCQGEWSATASSTAELKKCPLLKSIHFDSTPVTADTVSKLTALSDLRDLSINNTAASNELIAAISQFKELESLSLYNAEVTDEHVIQIAKLTKLKMLVLHQSPAVSPDKPKMTDQGLQALKSLKALKHLNVFGHSLSAEAASDFEKSLPNCRVLKSVTTPKTNIEP